MAINDALFPVARALQAIDMIVSGVLFSFFVYQRLQKSRCKFEVLYVTGVGTVTDLMKIMLVNEVPATFHLQENGNIFFWSRFAGWLATCPVLLIHLSNLAGKEVFDSRRLMKMLIAYQLLMVFGMSAAMCDPPIRFFFIFLGVVMLVGGIFKHAADIFKEAILTMPERAKPHLTRMAVVFFSSWAGFGFFFLMGPEGANLMVRNAKLVGFAICDNLSKNVYAWHGWYLRWNILRKASNPEQFVDEVEESDDIQYRVLLVEDDEVFSYYFYNMLINHKCSVEMAKTTDEIMLKLNQPEPRAVDMVFINFEMAKANGYNIMIEIRQVAYMLPVIAYGRGIPREEMEKSKNVSGIDDYLLAPFPDHELERKMLRWNRRMSVDPRLLKGIMGGTTNGVGTTGHMSATHMPVLKEQDSLNSTAGGGGMHIIGAHNKDTSAMEQKLEMLMQQLEAVKNQTAQSNQEVFKRLDIVDQRLGNTPPSTPPAPAPSQPHPHATFEYSTPSNSGYGQQYGGEQQYMMQQPQSFHHPMQQQPQGQQQMQHSPQYNAQMAPTSQPAASVNYSGQDRAWSGNQNPLIHQQQSNPLVNPQQSHSSSTEHQQEYTYI